MCIYACATNNINITFCRKHFWFCLGSIQDCAGLHICQSIAGGMFECVMKSFLISKLLHSNVNATIISGSNCLQNWTCNVIRQIQTFTTRAYVHEVCLRLIKCVELNGSSISYQRKCQGTNLGKHLKLFFQRRMVPSRSSHVYFAFCFHSTKFIWLRTNDRQWTTCPLNVLYGIRLQFLETESA